MPAADPPALAEAVLTLWRDPDAAGRMGDAGRRRVEERFDVRRMVSQYEALYLEEGTQGDRWLDAGSKPASTTTEPAEFS